MTLVGFLVLMGWIPSAAFLFFHGRAPWRKSPAGRAVMVMASVMFILMTLAMLRNTFGVGHPEWVRVLAFFLILVALWWKLITILRYEYGKPGGAIGGLTLTSDADPVSAQREE